MSILEALGVKPVINAAGTLTRLGGAVMPPEVVAAMTEAARHFIDLDEAQAKVGARVAQMLGVPAAHVCAGASAGIMAATAACLAGDNPAWIAALPVVKGPRHEVIIHRSHRNEYDQAVRVAGADYVEIGDALRTHPWELEAAIGASTAAIVLFEAFAGHASLPLPAVAEIARRHGVPVIVDAAAELPPNRNFRHFIESGADLVVFSGGKDIRGPQTTGLIIGRPDLVKAAVLNTSPNASVGRSMKVGKEELAGFLRALELYLAEDQEERLQAWEAEVACMIEALSDLPTIRAFRKCPADNGVRPEHIPRVYIEMLDTDPLRARAALVQSLRHHDPGIVVGEWDHGLAINPQTLGPGDADVVIKALRRILLQAAQHR
jgi:L-seryl-tRNA(Ser) seleniumtransferase